MLPSPTDTLNPDRLPALRAEVSRRAGRLRRRRLAERLVPVGVVMLILGAALAGGDGERSEIRTVPAAEDPTEWPSDPGVEDPEVAEPSASIGRLGPLGSRPALSPTGSVSGPQGDARRAIGERGRLVIVSDRAGGPHLFAVAADGSGAVQLTGGNTLQVLPAVSPDGTVVMYTDVVPGASTRLQLVSSGGQSLGTVPGSEGAGDASWSPDGTRIAFARVPSGGSLPSIWTMRLDGAGVERLTYGDASDAHPAWSPDGRRIAFARYLPGSSRSELWIVDADGRNSRRLTAIPGDSPAWSPDGSLLVFRSAASGGAALYALRPEDPTGKVTQLTDGAAWDGEPSWSPDGARIVFERDPDGHTAPACYVGVAGTPWSPTPTADCAPASTGPAPSEVWALAWPSGAARRLVASAANEMSPAAGLNG